MYGFGSSGDGILPSFLLLRQSALEFRTNYSIRVPCVSAKTDILVLQACRRMFADPGITLWSSRWHARRPRARSHAQVRARRARTCARAAPGTDA
eukprot:COSAG02_NODE_873_length_16302_cov_113.473616_4_plen_95_part_00